MFQSPERLFKLGDFDTSLSEVFMPHSRGQWLGLRVGEKHIALHKKGEVVKVEETQGFP